MDEKTTDKGWVLQMGGGKWNDVEQRVEVEMVCDTEGKEVSDEASRWGGASELLTGRDGGADSGTHPHADYTHAQSFRLETRSPLSEMDHLSRLSSRFFLPTTLATAILTTRLEQRWFDGLLRLLLHFHPTRFRRLFRRWRMAQLHAVRRDWMGRRAAQRHVA